jgi:TRAP-type C4-dicarboxylate transport system permease small subunit
MPLVFLVALPFIASVLAALMPSNARNRESTLAGLVALGCAIQAAWFFPQIAHGNVLRQEIEWLPALGLNLVFRMDGFAWLFCMLVLGIGALVVLYARYYMSASDPVPRFFSFFLAFMGAMMGVVLSGNLIQMVLFWELTSLFSFLLIGYWHHRRDARRGARMALTVTGAGGLCLLGRRAGAGPHRRQLRARRGAGLGRPGPRACALPRGAGAGAARRLHQERAVPVPLLAAARHGRAHAGVGLPALGHHGEARRVPDGAAVARALGHRAMVLDGGRRGRDHAAARRLHARCSSAT